MTSDQPVTSDSNERPAAALIDETDRFRGLAHMEMLSEWLAQWRGRSPRAKVTIPRNAAERHMMETGHRLRFGCCATEQPVDRNPNLRNQAA